MNLSVVIPVYNEAGNIAPLLDELATIRDAFEGYEVILVDDGSTDGTPDHLKQAQERYAFLRPILCTSNRGQSAAMLTGLNAATGELIATLDGDLQNDPADIPALARAASSYDVVCGYREKRMDSWSRRLGSRIANRVRSAVTNDGIRDTGCSLKVFKRECVGDLPPLDGVHRFMPAYFMLNGRTIHQLPVNHRSRIHGTSKYTNLKRLPRTLYDLWGFAWYRSRYLK
ncbi:MAG: dolichol-phosphate mannosyltransferase [Kiritimatiellia bacterium]|jgi:dolichol-phosphate mannosyltransferase